MANSLFHIKQKKGESLKSFAQSFNREKINILRCNEVVAIEAFRKGFTQESPLYDSFMMKTLTMMIGVLERTNPYIKLEENKYEVKKERLKENQRDTKAIDLVSLAPREKRTRMTKP